MNARHKRLRAARKGALTRKVNCILRERMQRVEQAARVMFDMDFDKLPEDQRQYLTARLGATPERARLAARLM